MELVFRIREDRLDKKGRTSVWADIHWAGHRVQPGVKVKVAPANWQPTRKRLVNTREDDSNAKNLRLDKVAASVGRLFTAAEAAGRAERDVTEAEVHTAVNSALGIDAPTKSAAAVVEQPAGLTLNSSFQEIHDAWREENRHKSATHSLRQYNPVVGMLGRFDESLRPAGVDRATFGRYMTYLYEQELSDSTIQCHCKFLRECFRMTGHPVPTWLVMSAPRTGRAPSLKKDEFLALVRLPKDQLWNYMHSHMDLWIFQTLLLLRDSDLRAIKPHHVRELDLPRYGPTLCLELHQKKTMEPVFLPLPPLAAAIWRRYEGRLPVIDQSHRTSTIKKMAEIAGLTREFVRVRFSGKKITETPGPIWQFLGTHAARHTGADLLVLGSNGNTDLKEMALGHKRASVYGYDAVERYAPEILDAWRVVFSEELPLAKNKIANASGLFPRFYTPRWHEE